METKVTHVQSAASYLPSGSSAATVVVSGTENNCQSVDYDPIVRTADVTSRASGSVSNVVPCTIATATTSSTSAYNTATFQTKNKRKNFNPRCSASADEEDTINPPDIHSNADNSLETTPEIDPRIEAASINWRKLPPPPPPPLPQLPHDSQSDTVGSTSEFGELPTNQFYNIPNTNFSIAKSMAATGEANSSSISTNATMASASPQTDEAASSVAALSRTAAATDTSAARLVTEMATVAHAVNSPQARLEFTCNAFNAVKELFNVYGLSISPSDIVDAFKKQAVGE